MVKELLVFYLIDNYEFMTVLKMYNHTSLHAFSAITKVSPFGQVVQVFAWLS